MMYATCVQSYFARAGLNARVCILPTSKKVVAYTHVA
jgi:hypothetical protein